MTSTKASKKLFVICLFLIATLFVAVSCSTTKTADQSTSKKKLADLRATKLYEEVEIEIGDNYFSPKTVTIKPNTIVIFTNKGVAIHDAMADNDETHSMGKIEVAMKSQDGQDHGAAGPKDANIIKSGNLKSKDVYAVVFTKEGEYGYHCHFHGGPKRGQYGTIIVAAE